MVLLLWLLFVSWWILLICRVLRCLKNSKDRSLSIAWVDLSFLTEFSIGTNHWRILNNLDFFLCSYLLLNLLRLMYFVLLDSFYLFSALFLLFLRNKLLWYPLNKVLFNFLFKHTFLCIITASLFPRPFPSRHWCPWGTLNSNITEWRRNIICLKQLSLFDYFKFLALSFT